jgi:hypothetical protein
VKEKEDPARMHSSEVTEEQGLCSRVNGRGSTCLISWTPLKGPTSGKTEAHAVTDFQKAFQTFYLNQP